MKKGLIALLALLMLLACAASAEETPLPAMELGSRILWRGLEGEDVAALQRKLQELGYLSDAADGIFGKKTRNAVMAFQEENGLDKVDGIVGEKTLTMLFSDDAVVRPTPTPTPTAVPTPTPTAEPTPTPSPTPRPTLAPTATPDVNEAPFEIELAEMTVDGIPVTLMPGRDEEGERLYPLSAIVRRFDYDMQTLRGSWSFRQRSTGREIAMMSVVQKGMDVGAMGMADGVMFLMDGEHRMYVYDGEAYVTASVLKKLGFAVEKDGETDVITVAPEAPEEVENPEESEELKEPENPEEPEVPEENG